MAYQPGLQAGCPGRLRRGLPANEPRAGILARSGQPASAVRVLPCQQRAGMGWGVSSWQMRRGVLVQGGRCADQPDPTPSVRSMPARACGRRFRLTFNSSTSRAILSAGAADADRCPKLQCHTSMLRTRVPTALPFRAPRPRPDSKSVSIFTLVPRRSHP